MDQLVAQVQRAHAAILVAVITVVVATADRIQLLHALFRRHVSLDINANVRGAQHGKLSPAVAQHGTGRIVEFDDSPGFHVDHGDAFGRLCHDGPVNFLPFGQFLLRQLGQLDRSDVVVGDHRTSTGTLQACDTHRKPALLKGRVAGVLKLKSALCSVQHRAYALMRRDSHLA